MSTLWDKRITQIDRQVGPLEWRGVREQLRKDAVRKRRGLPSRSVSLEAAFDQVSLRIAARKGETPNPELVAKLLWRLLRERQLERKLVQRSAARRRARPRVSDTKINLWRRRREWLREAQAEGDE